MCRQAEATRSADELDARTVIDSHTYTVWLQNVHPFSDNTAHHNHVRTGTQRRLQGYFDRVEAHADAPDTIQVRWTDDVRSENVQSNEIIIYFVQDYEHGLIRPYLAGRVRAARGEQRATYQSQQQQAAANTNEGLTYADASWALSEVYIEPSWDAVRPDPGASNYGELLENVVGGMMANIAFHEAMHNQIDEAHPDEWDLHAEGGGGLATLPVSDLSRASDGNINQLGEVISRDREQYRQGVSQPPEAAAAPSTPAAPDLGGLEDLGDPTALDL